MNMMFKIGQCVIPRVTNAAHTAYSLPWNGSPKDCVVHIDQFYPWRVDVRGDWDEDATVCPAIVIGQLNEFDIEVMGSEWVCLLFTSEKSGWMLSELLKRAF